MATNNTLSTRISVVIDLLRTKHLTLPKRLLVLKELNSIRSQLKILEEDHYKLLTSPKK